MKDAVGFGALNVDLIYEVEDFEFLKKEGINYELNGEVEGKPKDFKNSIFHISKFHLPLEFLQLYHYH